LLFKQITYYEKPVRGCTGTNGAISQCVCPPDPGHRVYISGAVDDVWSGLKLMYRKKER
jgi:hypothetical protein